METPESRLDHLVLAVPDLEAAAAEIRERWGCVVHPGGRHPRWGSWNAVVPLEDAAYLEIIAPHPEPPNSGERVFGLDAVSEAALATWAVRPGEAGTGARPADPLAGPVAAARAAGVGLGDVLAGSRRTPEGTLLEWRLTDPFAPRMDGTVPFVIHWGRTPHPSGVAGPEVSLVELVLAHPEPERLKKVLAALGAGGLARVTAATEPWIRAVLRTPCGEVEVVGP